MVNPHASGGDANFGLQTVHRFRIVWLRAGENSGAGRPRNLNTEKGAVKQRQKPKQIALFGVYNGREGIEGI